jgi:hypothetical protein
MERKGALVWWQGWTWEFHAIEHIALELLCSSTNTKQDRVPSPSGHGHERTHLVDGLAVQASLLHPIREEGELLPHTVVRQTRRREGVEELEGLLGNVPAVAAEIGHDVGQQRFGHDELLSATAAAASSSFPTPLAAAATAVGLHKTFLDLVEHGREDLLGGLGRLSRQDVEHGVEGAGLDGQAAHLEGPLDPPPALGGVAAAGGGGGGVHHHCCAWQIFE